MSDDSKDTNPDQEASHQSEQKTAEQQTADVKKSQPDTPRKTRQLDPRLFAYRSDLAAQKLYGRVNAPRYVTGTKCQVQRPAIALRKSPDAALGFETEALFGEHVTVYDEAQGWAWVQLDRDHYVGYLPADALTISPQETTHWVRATGTFVYPKPDIKSSPILHLSLTSEVTVQKIDGQFAELATGGFVWARHLAPHAKHERDFVEVAERLIETPYLWGGRTRVGIDCSGLVQIAMQAAGLSAPRDSDLQREQIGSTVEINADLDRLRRGDLIFWPGHVGIMVDGVMMIHANAHHMMTTIEPLQETASRIARDSGPISAIKRPERLSAQNADV